MKTELRRKRDLGKILDDSFALYRAHWRTLLAISALIVVPVYLLVYGVGLGYLWSGYDAGASGNEVDLGALADTFAGLVAQLFVVTPLVTAMTVHVVRTAADGSRAGPAAALRAGLDVFPKLLVAILLVGLGVFLGLIALIIPGVILAVRWVVVSQVVVVEGREGTDALRRSFDLTRDRGWHTFLVLFVLNLLVGVLGAVILVPLDYAAEQADTMALSMVSQILSSTLSLPLVAIAYTLLYYSLVAEKEGAAPADPATPAAPPVTDAQSLPGVPGTFGDGWAPPRPPGES
ncbi:MAG: hypothetical protein ACJ762_15735 [Solirubrobacteraceae bacterium]